MKHFYSQEEACDKLNLSPEGLKLKVRDGLLAEFRDGGRTIYKVGEVDELASQPRPLTPIFDTAEHNYAFEAMDQTGKEIKDTIDANSAEEALEQVRKMGLFPTRIRQVDKPKKKRTKVPEEGKKASFTYRLFCECGWSTSIHNIDSVFMAAASMGGWCPECGKPAPHVRSNNGFTIKKVRWVSHFELWKPSTWGKGEWVEI